jgi:DNA-binding transcriptional LysR family regulator
MELYQLKTFVAVAEEGHLTRAAERLHTSQPAVSAHVKTLEDELGMALFERTPRGMRLTHAGTVLKTRAEEVLKNVEAMRFEAGQLKEKLGGALRIGLNVNPRFLKVTEMLTVMRNTHPEVEMHFQQCMTWDAPGDLLADNLDAAFVYRVPEGATICAEHLDNFDLMVVGPMAWRRNLSDADWPEILSRPWVTTDAQCPFYDVITQLFERHGCKPNSAVVAGEDAMIKNFVMSGVGLGLMLAEEAREAASAGELFLAHPEPVAYVPLSFIYLCRRAQDPMIQAVLKCIQNVWRGRRETLTSRTEAGDRQQTA